MLFNSFIFFILLAIILPAFYLLPGKKSKQLFLLFSSYFFYAYWDWRFCGLLLLLTLVNYFVGKYLEIPKSNDGISNRKLVFIIGIFFNVGILVFFKYSNFFIDSLNMVFDQFDAKLDILHVNIIVPLGVSFFIFQSLAYIIDVYFKRVDSSKNLIEFSLFIAFFPKLIAGPIERAGNLLPQLKKELKPSKLQIKE